MSDLFVELGGQDVSGIAISGSSTRRLNRVSQASVRIPWDYATAEPGDALKISFDGGNTLHHHGRVLNAELDSGEDIGYITYNSSDPMELWQWRPVRADDGDFTKPAGDGPAPPGQDLFADYITGPQIMEAVLKNTEGNSTAQGNPALTPPSQAEGETFLTFGTFAGGGVSLEGAPTDWPMTIAQLASLLISTGELDLVITPTDPGGGIMGTIDGYNGDYGTDLSGSVVFEYGTGALNVQQLRWNKDMTQVSNKIWYYGGPRIGTNADPAGDQHWCWNITGDDPGLANPPGGDTNPYVPGASPLGDRIQDSRNAYGVRMLIYIWDSISDLCLGQGSFDPGRELYRRLWQAESWLRANPRDLIHITPVRGTEIGSFDIGDLVGVEIGSQIWGGASGAQRVYEYTISWDEDGPFSLSELQTTATNEGL